MKFKLFLVAALGACAHPVSSVSPMSEARVELPPIGASARLIMAADVEPVSTPSAPIPWQSTQGTSVGLGDCSPSGDPASRQQALQAWRTGFIERAVAAGVSRATVVRETANLTFDQSVCDKDNNQPEDRWPVGYYIAQGTTDTEVARARAKMAEATWLADIEARYGVPKEILVGVWRQESSLGAILGRYDVVNSLATLASSSVRPTPEKTANRRRTMEAYLVDALRAIDRNKLTRAELVGSWAGAVGQVQFMPSNILNYAVDADGDGRVDVRNSSRDALASAAVLLLHHGWHPGEGWQYEAALPASFDYEQVDQEHSAAEWERMGVRRADGRPWTGKDAALPIRLILPTGANGPAFFVLRNFKAVQDYNGSSSVSYPMTVGVMAERLRGVPAYKPWPSEVQFGAGRVAAAQRALTAQGFDTHGSDGKIGPDTRKALKAWQRANRHVPDGYLTESLISEILVR